MNWHQVVRKRSFLAITLYFFFLLGFRNCVLDLLVLFISLSSSGFKKKLCNIYTGALYYNTKCLKAITYWYEEFFNRSGKVNISRYLRYCTIQWQIQETCYIYHGALCYNAKWLKAVNYCHFDLRFGKFPWSSPAFLKSDSYLSKKSFSFTSMIALQK